MTRAFSVAVIGSGFSGVVVASHLLRARVDRPISVMMINRSGAMARGVAYGTNSPAHLLNVPAGRMTAFPNDPDHFLRFVQSRDPAATAGSFVPRSVYGEYLEYILAESEALAGANRLTRIVGEVVGVEPQDIGARLTLDTGTTLPVDRVVLALGNYPPADPPGLPADLTSAPYYVRDPWVPGALDTLPRDRPVLLLGTGLTMLDVALTLRARGIPGAIAVSRRGLLSRPHDPAVKPPEAGHRPRGISEGPATVKAYLRAVRDHVRLHGSAGTGNWRQVLDSLRPITPALWQALPTAERARFLRHVRPYWEAHRHRAAPATAAAVEALIESGWLTLRAARIAGGDARSLQFVPRGGGAELSLDAGAVVNCTGPAGDVTKVPDPLLSSLFASGLARPDPLGLGIDASEDGAVIGADGEPSRFFSYVGPLLKARDGEGTAVPELRVYAARTAAAVSAGAVTV